jgi:ATP-dependent protease HslVU (ClpYQ) peptidase subunit
LLLFEAALCCSGAGKGVAARQDSAAFGGVQRASVTLFGLMSAWVLLYCAKHCAAVELAKVWWQDRILRHFGGEQRVASCALLWFI